MTKKSKRFQAAVGGGDRAKYYGFEEALALVKQTASAKFDESVDVAELG